MGTSAAAGETDSDSDSDAAAECVRVLQLPKNVAFQGSLSSDAMRELGHAAETADLLGAVSHSPVSRALRNDATVRLSARRRLSPQQLERVFDAPLGNQSDAPSLASECVRHRYAAAPPRAAQ